MQGKMRTSPVVVVSASNACEQVLGETLSEFILSGSDAGIVWCVLACRLPACSSFV
jgi:hypothetical protein